MHDLQTSVRWPGYPHVIFDCDATLSAIEGIDSLAASDELARSVALLTDRAMSGDSPLETVYTDRLNMLRPSRGEIASVAASYRNAQVDGAKEVISALLELGHDVYVVSGGLAEPVREFAMNLGVPSGNIRAVETLHDSLSGDWWNRRASAGHAFVSHVPSPLATTNGKAAVIRELLTGTSGRSMLVGDGLTDLVARSAVDLFVGFGGVTRRSAVVDAADVYIAASRLDAVLPLAAGTRGLALFEGATAKSTFVAGLADVAANRVTFNNEDTHDRFNAAFAINTEENLMTSHRVLVCDALGPSGVELLASAHDVEMVSAIGASRSELLEAVADVDAMIVRSATTIDAEVLGAAERVRVVGRAGVGTDNIDVEAATRQGVIVTNTPFANTTATAEQTMMLMLAAVRHVAPAHQSMREGNWDRSKFIGIELKGKTLGIVGFGRVGRAVAARAKAFEMTVMAYDPYVSELVGREHGVVLAEFDDVLASADIVTLHAVPPTDGSALIDARSVAVMKQGSVLINAARGVLLDAQAVRVALDSGHLRSVGIDVYDQEPPPSDHPLVGHESVVHTPHLGASTIEAQRDVSMQIVAQVLAGLDGDTVENCVNVPFGFDEETEAQLQLATAMGRLQRVMADAPVTRVEVDVSEGRHDLAATVAAGFLSGLLEESSELSVNFVNAPGLAAERGIAVAQGHGIGLLDYPNLMTCRVSWQGGGRTMSGVVFGGTDPRIVQISDYHLDARPEGIVLLMLNDDTPGVVGSVGTLLASFGVNIAEWRLGRNIAGGLALSFINLDVCPSNDVLDALREVPSVTKAEVVEL